MKYSWSLVLFLCLLVACKKNSSITVNVSYQSAGQPVQVADSVVVVAKDVKDNSMFYMDLASSSGMTVFYDVKPGTYEVSSEMWDG